MGEFSVDIFHYVDEKYIIGFRLRTVRTVWRPLVEAVPYR
jgi:hypothetical protein